MLYLSLKKLYQYQVKTEKFNFTFFYFILGLSLHPFMHQSSHLLTSSFEPDRTVVYFIYFISSLQPFIHQSSQNIFNLRCDQYNALLLILVERYVHGKHTALLWTIIHCYVTDKDGGGGGGGATTLCTQQLARRRAGSSREWMIKSCGARDPPRAAASRRDGTRRSPGGGNLHLTREWRPTIRSLRRRAARPTSRKEERPRPRVTTRTLVRFIKLVQTEISLFYSTLYRAVIFLSLGM